ncbi:MAG TPA: alpha/beta hydrolase [Bacilli bacterium]
MSKSLYLWPQGAPFALGSAPQDCPSLVPFLIKSEKVSPAIIVSPGGGYEWIAHEEEGVQIALWLNSIGINAFVLNYRVKPYLYPCPLLDAKRAIRYVRKHSTEWNLDPGHIGILGFSAGGHVASLTGVDFDSGDKDTDDPIERYSSRPDLMVLCYPIITFGEHRHAASCINLLGGEASLEIQELASSENQVHAGTPPSFIWHTANDPLVLVENSLLFATQLSSHHVSFELHIYENGPHGMRLAEDDESVGTWTKLCALWLRKQGF